MEFKKGITKKIIACLLCVLIAAGTTAPALAMEFDASDAGYVMDLIG